MAYAAVVSLRHIIEQLQISDDQHSIPNYPNSQIQSLHSKICSLQNLLKEPSTVNYNDDLEIQIRDAIHEAEDIIESHISSHFLPSDGSSEDGIISRDLQKLLQELDSLEKRILTPVDDTRSVYKLDNILQLKNKVVGESTRVKVVSVLGRAGIGKTSLVNQVYDHQSIARSFDFRAWATIGPSYQRRDVLVALLKSVDRHQEITDDDQLRESISENLEGRRYLIVLDELHDIKPWDDLKSLFPEDGKGSRIILTTRRLHVALYASGTIRNVHHIRDLVEDGSWDVDDRTREFVGNEDGLFHLKNEVVGESSGLKVISLVGMVGIGKTALVREVYNDLSTAQSFHHRAWVTIGPNHESRYVLLALSGYMDHPHVLESHSEIGDDQLTTAIYKNLKGRKYLIVLDDLCDIKVWDDLKSLFPNDRNGSRVVLTTRLRKVALAAAGTTRNVHQIRFLDKDESWDLLHNLVFCQEPCPSNLSVIGKTVAQNCQGLPLTIVLLSGILAHAERTQEYWKKVADCLTSSGHTDDVGLTSVMQFLNEEHLPQHLKACFLYMGVFPPNHGIPTTRVVQLWVAERFLEPRKPKSMEQVAEECLEELVDRSLVLVDKWRSTSGIKTCSIHSVVWHSSINAAEHDNFFSYFNRYDTCEASPQSTSRLCIRKNVLFGVEDTKSAIASVSKARSLLCTGPEHLHPLRVFLDFRSLRVLNALTIRFFKFPNEILKLIQLRYLSLTWNGDQLPGSICKLWNLQFLIVRRHLSIKSNGSAPSYLPIEIWNMKKLRHLQIMGCDLKQPDDPSSDAFLENLLTLSDVSSHSCTKGVLERTSNLKKLGVRIELAEVDASSSPLSIFDNLELLFQLESFKCIIMNPDHGLCRFVISRPNPVSNLPSTLKKLTLSGCGFPWEDMNVLARLLPNLEVLKLRCYAFRGPEWELGDKQFIRLKYLLMEDMDIEKWIARGKILRKLQCLAIHHCYKLREIPRGVENIVTLRMLEVVDCSPSVVASAMRVKARQDDLSNEDLQVFIKSSWKENAKATK